MGRSMKIGLSVTTEEAQVMNLYHDAVTDKGLQTLTDYGAEYRSKGAPCLLVWDKMTVYRPNSSILSQSTDAPHDIVAYLAVYKPSPLEGVDTLTSTICPPTSSLMSTTTQVPRELVFNSENLVSVAAYVSLFIIAAIGNLTVFITLYKNRRRRSRVNLFIMHLSVADMIVTFVMLPLETAWHITVGWRAGDAACRLFMLCRVFGFYLSSFILIAISLDRYFAITHPLSLTDADRRGKIMLALAWLFSLIASIPQVSVCGYQSCCCHPLPIFILVFFNTNICLYKTYFL